MSSNQGVKAELASAVRRLSEVAERQSRQVEEQQEIIENLQTDLQMEHTRRTRQLEETHDE